MLPGGNGLRDAGWKEGGQFFHERSSAIGAASDSDVIRSFGGYAVCGVILGLAGLFFILKYLVAFFRHEPYSDYGFIKIGAWLIIGSVLLFIANSVL